MKTNLWKRFVDWLNYEPPLPTPTDSVLSPKQWRLVVQRIILTRGWDEQAKHLLVAHDRMMRQEILHLRRLLYAEHAGATYPIAGERA